MKRTGRNSAALSEATDALVRRKLIETCDENGEPLLTPQQRRSHQGRIYFGLNCAVIKQLKPEKPKSQLRNANTTKETENKRDLHKEARSIYHPSSNLYVGWVKAGDIAQAHYPYTYHSSPLSEVGTDHDTV